jgi:hypothetical protein
MRVLVCGGREFQDYAALRLLLDAQHEGEPITLLIHGDAMGADRLAGRWARTRGVVVKAFPANWDRDGKAAGPIRNSAMLAEGPELVIAFPGGRGTADMIRKAMKAGVPVHAPLNALNEQMGQI